MHKQRLCTALQGPCKNTIGTYLISVCCTRLQSLKPWFDSDSTLLIVIFRHLRPIPQPLPPRSSSRDGRPLSSLFTAFEQFPHCMDTFLFLTHSLDSPSAHAMAATIRDGHLRNTGQEKIASKQFLVLICPVF